MPFKRFWHESYDSGVPSMVHFEETTLSRALARNADRFPDHPALMFLGNTIRYRRLDEMVDRLSHALAALGICPGDRVATLLPNIPQATISIYAAFRTGAVVVPTNPLYTERELEYQLNDSGSETVITLDLLLPRLAKIRPRTGIRHIISCHINDYLPFPKKQVFPLLKKDMYRKTDRGEGIHEFTELLAHRSGAKFDDRSNWDELAALLYTGGTTGTSKGVMLHHSNLSSNVQQFRAWFPTIKDGEGSMLAVFPFFHSAGFTAIQNMCIWSGWGAVLVPRPETGIIVDLLKKYRPSFVPGVPTIFVGLLNDPRFRALDFSFVRGFFAGAAPLSTDTIRDLKELTGAMIVNVYGLTETSPLATSNPFQGKIVPGSIGLPLPNTDMRIVDIESGTRDMPVGEAGEVLFRGPQVMKGYYNKQAETDAVLKDGWLHTGDIGTVDAAGNLTIVDRKKDMIIAAGFNIYPNEIDDILMSHPDILEACTIGVPDTYRGETVKAYVALKPGASLSEEEVIAYCRENLAAYKVPRSIVFIDAIPKTTVGKILRRAVRELDERREREKSA